MYTTISLLLSATVLLVRAEDLEEVSDPRLFFANVTSSELFNVPKYNAGSSSLAVKKYLASPDISHMASACIILK